MLYIRLLYISLTVSLFFLFGSVAAGTEKLDIGINDSYQLATGDRIRIDVFGEDDLRRDVTLTNHGKISYPFLGELHLEGLTLKDLEELITNGLKGKYLINPEVNVSVLVYRPFFINGEIKKPGSYPFQPGLSLRKAIALAGGLTEYAFADKITVIQEKDKSKNPILINFDSPISPGDIVNVAEYKRIFINGQVKKPGSYPFQSGLTLRKIITLAGGFSQRADQDSGYVISEDDEDQEPKEIDLEDLVSPGDIITIKQSFF